MSSQPDWAPALQRLLGHPGGPGAELRVTDPDGTIAYRAPLARHYRIATDPAGVTVWLRPIQGGYQPTDRQPGEPDYRFSLNAARRRGLDIDHVDHDPGPPETLHIALRSGQHATIAPVSAELAGELDRWDTWVSVVLPADVEADLAALVDDSWHGPYA